MADAHRLGRRGEELAARFLERAGWTILERNYRSGRNEVDLVVRRGRTVAFVEVKARSGAGYGHPLEAITARKRREIVRVARAWLDEQGGPRGLEVRFDAVAVELGPGGALHLDHVADAWRAS